MAALGLCCCEGATLQLWCTGFSLQFLLFQSMGLFLGLGAQSLWHLDLVASQHVGSSWTGRWTAVLCIASRTLNHWTTREAHYSVFEIAPCRSVLRLNGHPDGVLLNSLAILLTALWVWSLPRKIFLSLFTPLSLPLIYLLMCLFCTFSHFIVTALLCELWLPPSFCTLEIKYLLICFQHSEKPSIFWPAGDWTASLIQRTWT